MVHSAPGLKSTIGGGILKRPAATDPSTLPLAWRSPVEADSHAGLPPAYIEVAEFDCLHDDGVLYAKLLQDNGISVEFHEVKGTMHGFDTVVHAPTSQAMLKKRTAYIRQMFAR